MNPIWEGANGQSCKIEKRRAFWKVIGQSFFQSRTFTFHFASWEGSGSSRFSHLALRRPPSQQLQFLRKTDQIHPPRPQKKQQKTPNKVLSREQHAAEWTSLLSTSYSSNIIFDCLTPQKKPPSTLFLSLKRGKFSRGAFYRQWQQHRESVSCFMFLLFSRTCLFWVTPWSRGQHRRLTATWAVCVLRVYMTACSCVSAASLQALLRPPAAQRQERFRSPAPTHCPHGASVDSRWPLLCRLYWPIVWGVTPP